MKVHVSELTVGDRLSAGVYRDKEDVLMLAPDKPLTEAHISSLIRHQIEYVDIYERPARMRQSEDEASSDEWEHNAFRPAYTETVGKMKTLFHQAQNEGMIAEENVDACYFNLTKHLRAERDVVSLLVQLGRKDEYTYEHSVQVALLSYYIARWTGRSEREATRIGKAGFLHDIGKCRIRDTILKKPGRLTAEEFDEVKKHTVYGRQIIESSLSDPWFAIAALRHHERLNGSGYPDGLTGDRIDPVSRIVAVADVYSAMISTRVYQKKRDLFVVLKEIYKMSFEELDAGIAHLFIRRMLPNFLGKRAELSNGKVGVIVFNHESEPFQPIVRIGEVYCDLSRETHLSIEKVFPY